MLNTMHYVKEKLVARIEDLQEREHPNLYEGEILMCNILIDLVNKELIELGSQEVF